MKKYIVVILIVLVGGALIIVPLLPDSPPDEVPKTPAVFAFKEDVGTFSGKKSTIKIDLNEKDLALVELVYDSEVIKSWKNPKGTLEYSFTPEQVGTFSIQVISTRKDGMSFTDDRNFRVLSDITPKKLRPEIIETYYHSITSYTQGLEFYEGRLFEGTGRNGESKISEITLNGEPIGNEQKLDATYFGEGITIFNGTLYQLTYRKGRCFTYSIDGSIQILPGDFNYVGQQGWGLCNDGTSLIMSDGTERLTFRNPETFQIEKTIDVYNDRGAMTQLNELEYIDGKIYANVYLTNLIVAIDPETGKILEEINCDAIEAIGLGVGAGNDDAYVMNGIAYNYQNGKLYVTGKHWEHMFEIELVAE